MENKSFVNINELVSYLTDNYDGETTINLNSAIVNSWLLDSSRERDVSSNQPSTQKKKSKYSYDILLSYYVDEKELRSYKLETDIDINTLLEKHDSLPDLIESEGDLSDYDCVKSWSGSDEYDAYDSLVLLEDKNIYLKIIK